MGTHAAASLDRIGSVRLATVVAAIWLAVAVVMAAQASLGSILGGGGSPTTIGAALGPALIQTVPWIPASLAVVALTTKYPVIRGHLPGRLALHLAAAVIVVFAVNLLVVLSYWVWSGRFQGATVLLREAARWTLLRFHLGLLIYAAVAAVTLTLRFYRDTRDRQLNLAVLEGQLTRARLDALTAQVRPHFLFNTLHTIGQLWRSGQPDAADQAVDLLGSLFHKVHRHTTSTTVPLAEELSMVEEYLAIERLRFRDRLAVMIHADEPARSARIPPFLIQPLVENAIRHGTSARSTTGHVAVVASVDQGIVVISVADDGPGIQAPSPQPGSGTGLRTTRERLTQHYGDQATLSITSDPDAGTTVTVRLPYQTTP